jgi:hypothetical protein
MIDPAIPAAVDLNDCSGFDVVTWIDYRGRETVLPVGQQIDGRFLPPVITDTVRVFGEAGERRLRQEHDAREIVLPLAIQLEDCPPEQALREALRKLGCQLNTIEQPGVLRVQSGSLPPREIVASYSGGFEFRERNSRVAQPVLVLRAHKPYWTSVADVELIFATGTGLPFFIPDPADEPDFVIGNPMPAFTLSVDTIVGSQAIIVPCDVKVWPVWTLTGPASDVILSNLTTGLDIDLTGITLGAGDVLTIDTNPSVKTITDQTGANRFGDLNPASTLFPLEPGTNNLLLSVDGFVQFQTSLTLAYRERFLTV